MPLRERVVVYVERHDALLVFDHRDHPEEGTQVPAGGVCKRARDWRRPQSARCAKRPALISKPNRRCWGGSHEHLDGLGQPAISHFFRVDAPMAYQTRGSTSSPATAPTQGLSSSVVSSLPQSFGPFKRCSGPSGVFREHWPRRSALLPEIPIAAEYDIRALRGTLGFDVAVLGFHPSFPLRACGFAVAVDPTLEPYASIGLDPD